MAARQATGKRAKHGEQRRIAPQKRAEVFLNIPYDEKFENLYLAYICGIQALGMDPRMTLEIGGKARLERILSFVQGCRYSVHDLSWIGLDGNKRRTPRFNMPFELGLAVAWERTGGGSHTWFVMEEIRYRLAKSLSDLNGTDPYIHGGTIRGVFRELGNAFVRRGKQPSIRQMWRIYREVRKGVPAILRQRGASSVFEARVFRNISLTASAAAKNVG